MQDWTKESMKRCVLICDAPCHGKEYTDEHDYYENGTPFGVPLSELMVELKCKDISFQFLKLSKETQKMEEDMNKHNSKIEIINMIAI